MSFNSTSKFVDEDQGTIWPPRESACDRGVLTMLGNDARCVVSVHPSCRGARVSTSRPVLRAANNELTGRHYRSRPPVPRSLAQARSVSSRFSVFPAAGLATPLSQGSDWVG